jgi:hypothetical protein
MRIVNPTFGIAPADGVAVAPTVSVDWLKDPIVLFSNSKPNAKELLEGIRSKLSTMRNVDRVDVLAKDQAGMPAPAAMIEKVAANYKIALQALAD